MRLSTLPSEPIFVAPGSGERLRFLGASTMSLKLDGAGSDVAFYEYESEPGVAGAPQHVHHGHDETFYVVAGEYEFSLGAETVVAPSGAFLHVPRGTPHAFRNAGPGIGRIVGTFNPPQFADYFRELAAMIADGGSAPDHDAWVALYARYDTTFYAPSA
jgi:quercetin dioxygenase-like cupin family protein